MDENSASLGWLQDHGSHVIFRCTRCQHAVWHDSYVLIALYGPDTTLAQLDRRLRCRACGARAGTDVTLGHQADDPLTRGGGVAWSPDYYRAHGVEPPAWAAPERKKAPGAEPGDNIRDWCGPSSK